MSARDNVRLNFWTLSSVWKVADFKAFVLIALPMLAGSVSDIVLSLVDTAIVGRLGAHALAAVATGSAVYALVVNVIVAVAVGYQVLVAQAFGAKQHQQAGAVLFNSAVVLLPIAMLVSAMLLIVPGVLLQVFTVDAQTRAVAENYLRFRALALVLLVLSTLMRSTFDSERLTKWGMFAAILTNALNVLLSFLLVYGFGSWAGLGAPGSGLAATIASAFGAAFLLLVGRNSALIKAMHVFQQRVSATTLRSIFRISSPEVVSAALDYFGNLVFLVLIARVSVDDLAAGRVVYLILTVLFTVAFAVGRVAQINMGRAWGAQDYVQFMIHRQQGFAFSAVLVGLVGLVPLFFPSWVMRLFTHDVRVIEAGTPALIVVGSTSLFVALAQTSASYLRSVGQTKYVMIANVTAVWAVQIPLTWLLCYRVGWGLTGAYMAFAAYFLARFALAMVFARKVEVPIPHANPVPLPSHNT